MGDIWFISDTHFGHSHILSFKRDDGSPLRPFKTIFEMTECIFDNWNQTVKTNDKIYHLGDLAFGTDGKMVLRNMFKLPGKKRLLLGNHDKYNYGEYCHVFQQVHGVKQMEGYWLSHAPLHSRSVTGRKFKGNIHGHLHANIVGELGYFNAAVERINYTPINLDEIAGKLISGALH